MTLATRETLTEQIARHLEQQIILGRYEPGQKLKELEIARALDVSSNTVREAFHVIEKRHLVTIEPRRGAFVSRITPQQVNHLYDFMFLQFGELARRAARHWQADDLQEFATLADRMEAHVQAGEGEDFHRVAFDFVTAALRFADNHYLERSLLDLLPELKRCAYIAMQAETSEMGEALALFRHLLATMLQRDAEAAAEAARAYGEHQCRVVLKAISLQA